ncbi:MFS transporter [Streptomyces sp. NPDC086554]|uniref:MFS transporter n=1 Tax=Streptomyces sp. NPDC086554 TaxID=3154864 RepID=UPI0034407365
MRVPLVHSGEWGGAALLAVEHAPKKKRGLCAAFPQLGPSVGFFAATGVFWLLSAVLSDDAFRSWGWCVPFLPVLMALAIGGALFCMGVVYGPMGAYLPELFGRYMRYSGASLAYNLGAGT